MTEISSRDNSVIKHIRKLQRDSGYRSLNGLFVAEGLRLSRDALNSTAHLECLVVTEQALAAYPEEITELRNRSDKSYLVSSGIFSSLSDTKAPQGVLLVVKALDNHIDSDTIKGKYILLENIQDPTNLGSVLRCADAFGLDGVYMTGGCCDIYSPKVCRASMGAVFRVPFAVVTDAQDFISGFNRQGSSYAAVVRGGLPVSGVDFADRALIVIGNEGNGLSPFTASACTFQVTIPMNGNAESLNASVAAGILMWEMKR